MGVSRDVTLTRRLLGTDSEAQILATAGREMHTLSPTTGITSYHQVMARLLRS